MKKAGRPPGKHDKKQETVPTAENDIGNDVTPKSKKKPNDIQPLDNSLPIVLTDGTTELCRRSSRKKTMKFDIKEVLNIKTTPKIQIEARIDTPVTIPPEIPRRISICKNPASKPKSIIQDFVSISPPPPSSLPPKKRSISKGKKEATPEKIETPPEIPEQCTVILHDFMEMVDDDSQPKEKEPKRRSVRLKTTVGGPIEDKRLFSVEREISIGESSNDSSFSESSKKRGKKPILSTQNSVDSSKSDDSNVTPSPVVSECSTDVSDLSSKVENKRKSLKCNSPVILLESINLKETEGETISSRRKTLRNVSTPSPVVSVDPSDVILEPEPIVENKIINRRKTMRNIRTPSPAIKNDDENKISTRTKTLKNPSPVVEDSSIAPEISSTKDEVEASPNNNKILSRRKTMKTPSEIFPSNKIAKRRQTLKVMRSPTSVANLEEVPSTSNTEIPESENKIVNRRKTLKVTRSPTPVKNTEEIGSEIPDKPSKQETKIVNRRKTLKAPRIPSPEEEITSKTDQINEEPLPKVDNKIVNRRKTLKAAKNSTPEDETVSKIDPDNKDSSLQIAPKRKSLKATKTPPLEDETVLKTEPDNEDVTPKVENKIVNRRKTLKATKMPPLDTNQEITPKTEEEPISNAENKIASRRKTLKAVRTPSPAVHQPKESPSSLQEELKSESPQNILLTPTKISTRRQTMKVMSNPMDDEGIPAALSPPPQLTRRRATMAFKSPNSEPLNVAPKPRGRPKLNPVESIKTVEPPEEKPIEILVFSNEVLEFPSEEVHFEEVQPHGIKENGDINVLKISEQISSEPEPPKDLKKIETLSETPKSKPTERTPSSSKWSSSKDTPRSKGSSRSSSKETPRTSSKETPRSSKSSSKDSHRRSSSKSSKERSKDTPSSSRKKDSSSSDRKISKELFKSSDDSFKKDFAELNALLDQNNKNIRDVEMKEKSRIDDQRKKEKDYKGSSNDSRRKDDSQKVDNGSFNDLKRKDDSQKVELKTKAKKSDPDKDPTNKVPSNSKSGEDESSVKEKVSLNDFKEKAKECDTVSSKNEVSSIRLDEQKSQNVSLEDFRKIESVMDSMIGNSLYDDLEDGDISKFDEKEMVLNEDPQKIFPSVFPKEEDSNVIQDQFPIKSDSKSHKTATSQKMKTFEDVKISENFGKINFPKKEEIAEEENCSQKKKSTKNRVQKPDINKKKLKKSLEKGAEILQKVVESVKNKTKILKKKKNSDSKIACRRMSLPYLSKSDKKIQLKAIRDSLNEPSAKIESDSAQHFESDSAIKLRNGLIKCLTEDDSNSKDTQDSLLTRSFSTCITKTEPEEENTENAVDLLLESFQVKSKKTKKEAPQKKKKIETSDPLDDIEKFIAISENLLSKPENKENKDILVKKLFNDIKEFEANVKQEILPPPRRSHRLQTISKTVSKSSKGVVRNEKYSMEDYKMDLAELEAENAKFLKDMEERLTQFSVIRKSEYMCERIISKEAERMVCDCYLTREEEESGAFGCGEDCLNRLLMIECGDDCVVGDRCTNRRFQNYMYSHCKVFRTEKKGFGIMADAEINPGDFIMEYVGEVINTEQFEERREEYSKDKNAHYYFMALRSDSIIDATSRGNISRFINHSCEPNAETQKWTVNGELRIGFFCVKKILPGEEITFDYQFQRYGREAQKCFCESENCRGWIGEEPDSEEELEEDEEEQEEEEEEVEVEPVKEIIKPEIVPPAEIQIEEAVEEKLPEIPQPVPPPIDLEITKPPQPVPPPAEIAPIEKVVPVKPKVPKKIKRKPQVLEDYDIIENVESLMRSGLKNQAQTLKLSRLMVRSKLLLTRIKILQIIQNGEMPCKRLFLDYHGLRFLHEWMVDIKEMDEDIDLNIYQLKMAFLKTLDSLPICNKTVLKESGILEVIDSWSESKEKPSNADDDSNDSSEPTEKTVFDRINKLLEKWQDLPEVFKIPKKERIEQMKEHEREADRAFKTLNIADEIFSHNKYRFNKMDYKRRSEQYSQRTNSMFSWTRTLDTRRKDLISEKMPNDHLSKEQRREMFALKVKRDENEKRLAEENRMVDVRCKVFGLDPKTVDKSSLPYCLNNKTMEWYSQGKKKISVPPSYAICPPQKKTKSTNPEDYRLPKMNLPADWRFALDALGRCYYFNKRLRISQWHQPITLKPSGDNSFIKLPAGTKKEESDEEDAGSDLSGDETELWLASKNPNSLKDYITAKVEKRRMKRNNFLVKERAISPRREEDRLHNQIEMKKYKETKEKLRRRKEKRRKSLMLDPNSSVASQLPIQDFLLSSDDEDYINLTGDQQQTTTCPLIDKIVEDDKLVDEVEFIDRHKPLKRHLIGSSRDKYEHRKRQKMDGSYKRDPSSSGRSSSKHKSSEPLSKKSKERFRSDIGLFIMQNLIHYRKPTCASGRITTPEDFDHLTRKLTHYILTKESRHCGSNLEVTESVKNKTREYIKKYMIKYGDVYTKPSGDPEFKEIPNIKSLLAILEEYERVEDFDIYKT